MLSFEDLIHLLGLIFSYQILEKQPEKINYPKNCIDLQKTDI